MNSKFLASVFLGQPFTALRQLISNAPAIGNVLKYLRNPLNLGKLQAIIPKPFSLASIA